MNRDAILDAAAQIFSKKGFHAASMQDIAEAVSLQKGSLYYHVASKQEILVEILDRALDLLTERMEVVLAQPLPPEKKLRLAMSSYLNSLLQHFDIASVLILEHRSLEPELQARHILKRDNFEGLWRTLIQEGEDSGIFNCTDVSFAARSLLGMLNWTITWYRPGGPLTPEEIASQYADLFLNGLLVRNGNR